MTDQYVQVAPNSTGAKIDVSEVVVGPNTAERQRINLADPVLPTALQTVALRGEASVLDPSVASLLHAVLVELRVHSYLLRVGLNISDNLTNIRASV